MDSGENTERVEYLKMWKKRMNTLIRVQLWVGTEKQLLLKKKRLFPNLNSNRKIETNNKQQRKQQRKQHKNKK
jgi:hypothetical protein